MTAAADDRRLLGELGAASRRATDWVLARQAPSGVLGDPANGFKYHRGPWALAMVGEVEAAMRVCDWVRDHLLRDGRLAGDARVLRDGWAYRDSVLMMGAHLLGRYDLSHGLVDDLLRWQDPISGGFANDALEDGSGSDEMDIPYAAGPGFALLATGRLAAARRVRDFLATIHDAQTGLPERFFCFWSRSDQRPIVESDPTFQRRFLVDQRADEMQRWTIGGIAAGFLGRLHLADPDPATLDLARRYQAFSMDADPVQFGYPSVCKSSWGAAVLYEITREEQYRRWLHRMGAWYLDRQEPDGLWHPWVERTESDVIEITLEFIMHIETIRGALGGALRT